MTSNTIKTRILLRNDTLANWESSQLSLAQGEVAIATVGGSLAEVRVGTGENGSTWANSLKLKIDASQISGLVEAITPTIEGVAKKYQVVSTGDNAWKLQEAALSSNEWTDVAGSAWSIDLTGINAAIGGLTEQLAATNTTLNIVSSDYVKATDFAAHSNDIGLSAASAANKIATQEDVTNAVADLAGAMHFKGAVSEKPADGAAGYSNGDIVIVTSTSKEYVYYVEDGETAGIWIELGDESLYATKSVLETISSDLTGQIDFISGEVDAVNATLYTVSSDYLKASDKTELEGEIANALTAANNYTDGKFTDFETNTLTSYALSDDVTGLVSTVSGDTLTAANAFTTEKVDALSDVYIKNGEVTQDDLSGYFIFDCGGASLRTDEPTV